MAYCALPVSRRSPRLVQLQRRAERLALLRRMRLGQAQHRCKEGAEEMTLGARALERQIIEYDFFSHYPGCRKSAVKAAERFGAAAGSGEELKLSIQLSRQAAEFGETFGCASNICNLIESAAPALPPWTLERTQLFAMEGYCLFEHPLEVPHPLTDYPPLEMDVLSWSIGIFRPEAGLKFRAVTKTPKDILSQLDHYEDMLWILPHMHTRGSSRDGDFALHLPWWFGMTSKDFYEAGSDEERIYAPFYNYFACLMTFLSQRIAVAEPHRLDRAARHRLEKAGLEHDPIIRTITLRRYGSPRDQSPERQEVDWSSRWWVRGHWRRQWFSATKVHRPVWITPHIKGPADKPVKKPSNKVFVVIR